MSFFWLTTANFPDTYAPPLAECEKPIIMCESPTSLVVCVENSDGTFTKYPMATCKEPETCLNDMCQVVPGGQPDEPFVCSGLGVFPDQFDCKRFHFCLDEGSGTYKNYAYECDDGFFYNARTTYCDRRLLPGGHCPDLPVSSCKYAGQNGALKENDSIYYICRETDRPGELYPFLYVCPNGGVFSNYVCALRD